MSNPAFMINPLSHTVQKNGSQLKKAFQSSQYQFIDNPFYTIDTFHKLDNIVKSIISNNIDHVFIEGGDGTIHGVLDAFMHQLDSSELPNFTLLPGGMTNLIARHLGITSTNPDILNAVLSKPKTRPEKHLSMLGLQSATQIKYGFLFSTGALPKATHYCAEKVHSQGITGAKAVRTTLMNVLLGHKKEREAILSPTNIKIKHNYDIYEGGHILSLATTLPSLMIGLNPFWGHGDGAIKFSFAKHDAKNYLSNVIRMLRKRQSPNAVAKLTKDGFVSINTDKLTLRTNSEIVLDGEFLPFSGQEISLFASPPIRFIR